MDLERLVELAVHLLGARSGRLVRDAARDAPLREPSGDDAPSTCCVTINYGPTRRSEVAGGTPSNPPGPDPPGIGEGDVAAIPVIDDGSAGCVDLHLVRGPFAGCDDGPPPLQRELVTLLAAAIRVEEQLRRLGARPLPSPADDRLQAIIARLRKSARRVRARARGLHRETGLAAEICGADIARVYFADGEGAISPPRSARELPHGLARRLDSRPNARSLAGQALSTGCAVVVQDLDEEQGFYTTDPARRLGCRCGAAVPFGPVSGPRGVVLAFWRARERMTPESLEFVHAFARALEAVEEYREACRALGRSLAERLADAEGDHVPWTAAILPAHAASCLTVRGGAARRATALLENAGGLFPGDVLPQGDRGWCELARALRRGEPWHGDLEFLRRHGGSRWIRLSAIPAAWHSTEDGTHHVLWNDVTGELWLRDQLESAIARSRSLNGDAIGVAVLSTSGQVLTSNEAWRRRRERRGCLRGTVAFVRTPAEARLCSQPCCASFVDELESGLFDVAYGRRASVDAGYRCLQAEVERWFSVRLESAGKDPAGEPRAIAFEWDDTARQQAEDELRRRAAGAEAILRSSLDAVLTLNHCGVIESANPAATGLLGWSGDDLSGRRLQQIFPAENEAGHDPSLYKALRDDLRSLLGAEREVRARRGSGASFPAAMTLFETAVGLYPMYTIVLRDLSEQRRAEERIEKLAYHDVITGLPNRLLLRDRLDQALAQARRARGMLGILFVNINRFKRINDSWGHVAGDRLLSAVARRIEGNVRGGDLVARWSGDEYNVLLPRLRGPEEARTVAGRVRDALRAPIEIDEEPVYITVSIGLSVYPRDGADGDSLIRQADLALCQAKRRGVEIGEPDGAGEAKSRSSPLHLDAELHRAVEQGEFLVHYQPEVELASGRIVGVECLVRWQHPTLGLLRPDVFIGPSEDSGLIVPLGRGVLEQACRQIAIWQQSTPGRFRVAVNLSSRQLRDPSLVDGVAALLRETGIRPDWLDLEVTETVAISSVSRRLRILERLRALGVRMSLDDFGQGYSSLNRLRRLPVQTLKIDRAFVHRLQRDARDAAIVRAIIQMGHSFRLHVVAEGVEKPEEAAFLLAEGCDTAQGFLYSPPVPLEDFERLWREQNGEQMAA